MIDGAGYPLPNGAIFGYDAALLVLARCSTYQPAKVAFEARTVAAYGWRRGPGLRDRRERKQLDLRNYGQRHIRLEHDRRHRCGRQLSEAEPERLGNRYFRWPWLLHTRGADLAQQRTVIVFGHRWRHRFWLGRANANPRERASKLAATGGQRRQRGWPVVRESQQPGGHSTSCDNLTNPCNCAQQSQDNNIQVYWTGTNGGKGGPTIHTSPAFWEYDLVQPELNYIFITPQKGESNVPAPLTRYPLCAIASAQYPIDLIHCTGGPVEAVNSMNDVINFVYGATPAISSNGQNASDAIVWAIKKPDGYTMLGTTPGVLYAIDAVIVSHTVADFYCNSEVAELFSFSDLVWLTPPTPAAQNTDGACYLNKLPRGGGEIKSNRLRTIGL
jgi:hypothetical protein